MPVLSFIRLSHPKATASTLGRGAHDIQFVAMCVLLFTAVRASCVNHIFRPFAARRGLKPKAAIRFAEQGWQFIYYSTYWTFGMYIWMTSSYWLNFSAIWADWPIYETSASVKIYTLSQMAFWIQQIFVLNMEERRKDYYQMLFHHILTTTLLILAYAYGFFNVTNVVLCLMDVVDMLLPLMIRWV
ncbi:sphingosine N-acyltransferase lag1 [Ascosphaera acerosa]|nr:sphingosine N-acyltransferase lag1 [Ascosphaera acerosa]